MYLFKFLFQSRCRQFLARLYYSRTKKAAITTQCAWRGKVARKELRKLKMVNSSTPVICYVLSMLFRWNHVKVSLRNFGQEKVSTGPFFCNFWNLYIVCRIVYNIALAVTDVLLYCCVHFSVHGMFLYALVLCLLQFSIATSAKAP